MRKNISVLMYSLLLGVFVTSCNFQTNDKTQDKTQEDGYIAALKRDGKLPNEERTQTEQPQENTWEKALKNKFIGKYKIINEYGGHETVFEVLPDGRVVEYSGNNTKQLLGEMVVLNQNAFVIGGESPLGKEFQGIVDIPVYKGVDQIYKDSYRNIEYCGTKPNLRTCIIFDVTYNRGYVNWDTYRDTYPEVLSAYENRDVSTAYFIKFKKI